MLHYILVRCCATQPVKCSSLPWTTRLFPWVHNIMYNCIEILEWEST